MDIQIDAVKFKTSQDVFTLEEAIEEAKIGKFQITLIILTAISVLGSAIENTNISYILPYAKCDLQLTTGEQGLLSAISYLGIVFTSHLWGFLADTWGRQKVLRVAAIGGFIFSFLSAFAMNTASMIVLRFLAGAFVAGSAAGGYSYISEFHTSATAARAAAFVSIALSTVWVLMSPLALVIIPMDWSLNFWILQYKPWRFFMTCTSLINLWNLIVFSILPETPKFLLAMNPVKYIESKPLFTNTWKFCYIIFVMFSIGHGTFMCFPDFLIQLQTYEGIPKTLCEIVGPKVMSNSTEVCIIDYKNLFPFQLLFGVGVCFLALSALSSFYLKKIAPKKLVCSWLFMSMIACISLNFLSEFSRIVASFVLFLSANVCANIVMAVAMNLFPTNYRAMSTAFIMMCGRIGGVSGSSLVGLLLNYNCTLIFYSFGAILISCAFVFMMAKIKSQ